MSNPRCLQVPMVIDHYVDIYPIPASAEPIYYKETRLVLRDRIWKHREYMWENGCSIGMYEAILDSCEVNGGITLNSAGKRRRV